MNGAGMGGRLVANRNPNSSSQTQIGNRAMRQQDLEAAFKNGSGMGDANRALGARNRRAMGR